MSTSARRTLVAIRPRGARSSDPGHALPVAPRSRPCLAARRTDRRLKNPARPTAIEFSPMQRTASLKLKCFPNLHKGSVLCPPPQHNCTGLAA
jgi:hypothetical protein